MVSNELGNPQTESKDKLDRAGPASLVMLDPINTLKGPISGSAGAWGWHGHGGKGPRAVDVQSFRDFFELAVLAQVDECYVASHFGSLASRARSQFNRSACQGQ